MPKEFLSMQDVVDGMGGGIELRIHDDVDDADDDDGEDDDADDDDSSSRDLTSNANPDPILSRIASWASTFECSWRCATRMAI